MSFTHVFPSFTLILILLPFAWLYSDHPSFELQCKIPTNTWYSEYQKIFFSYPLSTNLQPFQQGNLLQKQIRWSKYCEWSRICQRINKASSLNSLDQSRGSFDPTAICTTFLRNIILNWSCATWSFSFDNQDKGKSSPGMSVIESGFENPTSLSEPLTPWENC